MKIQHILFVFLCFAFAAGGAQAQSITGGGPAPLPIGGGGGASGGGGGSAAPGVILGGIAAFMTYRAVVCASKAQTYGMTCTFSRGCEVRGKGRAGCNNDAYYGRRNRRGELVSEPWNPFPGF